VIKVTRPRAGHQAETTSAADVQASILDADCTFFAPAHQARQHGPAVPDGVIFIAAFLMGVCYAIPNDMVFNDYANRYKDAPLTAKAGPSEFFGLSCQRSLRRRQSGQSYRRRSNGHDSIGRGSDDQLTMPQPGLYPFVTHSFVDVGKEAPGMIKETP
jgi:hypothetical protein